MEHLTRVGVGLREGQAEARTPAVDLLEPNAEGPAVGRTLDPAAHEVHAQEPCVGSRQEWIDFV